MSSHIRRYPRILELYSFGGSAVLIFGHSPATIFLQQSMERYASLDTYQAECDWDSTEEPEKP